MLEKREKFCDNLLRKGFESNLIYEKLRIGINGTRMT
jgi:regulatory protein